MNYYVDITIKPDAEMRENLLRNKVYAKLHKRLYDLRCNTLGVSFPRYEALLGRVIRLHGAEGDLTSFVGSNWLGGLTGYCTVAEISVVPDVAGYRTVSRVQTNMSPAKLRRLQKRAVLTESEIKAYREKMFSTGLNNPYLELESGSNGHKHRRYIQFGELVENPVVGNFDAFGLSKTATIPWF